MEKIVSQELEESQVVTDGCMNPKNIFRDALEQRELCWSLLNLKELEGVFQLIRTSHQT